MRQKFVGFMVATSMLTMVGAMEASPSFATDYFVRNLGSTTQDLTESCASGPVLGAQHGSAVIRRTAAQFSATVYLRNASHNAHYLFHLVQRRANGTCVNIGTGGTTDSNGNATVHLAPKFHNGAVSLWVFVAGPENYVTAPAPAHGF